MSYHRPRLQSRSSSSTSISGSGRLRAHSRRRRSSAHSPHGVKPSLFSSGEEPGIDTIINVSLDNSLPKDYFTQDVLSVIKQLRIKKWRRIPKEDYRLIQLDRISGALTNCIYKVTYKDYYPLLLRLYGDVEDIIDRDTELNTLMRMSQQNIGPRLLGCFTNGRFEEFLNKSITLSKEHIRVGKISRMIARRMKELHTGISLTQAEIDNGPVAWNLIDKWISLIDQFVTHTTEEDQRKVFYLTWNEFKNLFNVYRKWVINQYDGVDNLKEALRFCHNDTQYGNLLFYDKSQRLSFEEEEEEEITLLNLDSSASNSIDDITTKASSISLNDSIIDKPLPIITDVKFPYDTRLTVIDFEYAGANLAAYDITNHFSEWMYDYHDENYSYKTHLSKYPNKEERLNLLNSYIQYVPGSVTPSLGPMHNLQSPSTFHYKSKTSGSMVTLHSNELPAKVIKLYNETILWRTTNLIFWSLWGVISKGSITTNKPVDADVKTMHELGPNGEEYTIIITQGDSQAKEGSSDNDDEELMQLNNDDNFDHLKYTHEKLGCAIGDCIQFGLIHSDQIDPKYHDEIKYLDAEFIPLN